MTKASCARTALGVLLLSASINAQQELKILAIVNAASYEAGVPRGGALASIFCTGLLDINGTILPQPSSPLPSSLHDVQVRINGGTAPILSISQMDSYEQINI